MIWLGVLKELGHKPTATEPRSKHRLISRGQLPNEPGHSYSNPNSSGLIEYQSGTTQHTKRSDQMILISNELYEWAVEYYKDETEEWASILNKKDPPTPTEQPKQNEKPLRMSPIQWNRNPM